MRSGDELTFYSTTYRFPWATEEIATVAIDAVNDGKDQVLYTAGAEAMYERRLEMDPEASRKEIAEALWREFF